jgi:hypothetical protein
MTDEKAMRAALSLLRSDEMDDATFLRCHADMAPPDPAARFRAIAKLIKEQERVIEILMKELNRA